MKTNLFRLVVSLVVASLFTSCTTVYDPYGRPYQTVDPGAALVGAAAVGLLAYGLASSYDNNHCNGNYHGYRHRPYYGSYGRHYGGHGGYHRGYCAY